VIFFPRFPHLHSIANYAVSHTCYIPRLSQSSLFYHLNNIWWGVQIIKFHIMLSSWLLCYHVPLRPKYLPQHPILEHPQPMFLPQCERPSSSPIKTTGHNIIVLYIFSFMFVDSELEDKDSAPNKSVQSSEISVTTYQSTQSNIPEHLNLEHHHCQNLRSHIWLHVSLKHVCDFHIWLPTTKMGDHKAMMWLCRSKSPIVLTLRLPD